MTEQEVRSGFLSTLLTTPHRDLASLQKDHEEMIVRDPIFYVHLAAWYADNGQVRDHKEMFVIMLCLSDFEGHRDVGLALLRRLPPYQVARVVDYIKGTTITQRRPKAALASRQARPRRRRRRPRQPVQEQQRPRWVDRFRALVNREQQTAQQPQAAQQPAPQRQAAPPSTEGPEIEYTVVTKQVGLGRNIPRSMRTEITRYLREREADPRRFDRTVLVARKPLKRLYAGLHIQPSARAQAILFDDDPPPDSLSFKLKQIAKAESPADQARAIAEYKIPYRVASSVINEMTPMVLAALIDVMTPQEVINNIGSLKRRGAFDNKDIKSLIDQKVVAAKSDKRVSAYKAKVAAEAAGATGELAEALDEVTEAQVKATGTISRSTALLIDKSGSMQQAIEVGKQLGAMISAISAADLYTYAFDTVAYPIKAKGESLADWEKALKGIQARGGTSCGVAIEQMRRRKQWVEQIVMVTDEGENTAPLFGEAYQAYAAAAGIRPAVILVRIGRASNYLERVCHQLGVPPNVFEFKGDYYALPNVIPLLTYPSLADMVMEVLAYPLPERAPA
ncbi:MAG: hypothetical protein PVH18_07475 [Chloroflexota bacterium]|jgi:hypothetical protein